jgi:RNA polymerase sigma-54 factor
MKQGLQLRLSQQLAMTPQLQQAIRLLQLSTLELQQELQQALESNPLLEQTDLHEEVDAQQSQDNEGLDTVDALEQKEMPEELPLDASWDEIYTAGTPSGSSTDYLDDELPVYQGETTQSLQDYLMWQVELTPSQIPIAPLRPPLSTLLMTQVISPFRWKTSWKAWAMKRSVWMKSKRY